MSSSNPISEIDVASWLEQLGLPQYVAIFQRQGITPQVLGTLSDAELREIGVDGLGHRKTILLAIANLEKRATVAAVAPPRANPAPAVIPPTPQAPTMRAAVPVAAPVSTETSQPVAAVATFAPLVAASPVNTQKRWSWKRFGGKFLVISILVHVLFAAGAGIWVVQEIQAKRKLTFKAGEKSPNPSTRAIEHKVQMQKKKSTMSAPAQAKRITTTGLSKVALPDMPAMSTSSNLTPNTMGGAGGVGSLQGIGGVGGMGGGAGGGGLGINFFGLRTSAKRIAFLLDYSGSMSGPFRKTMEQELENALKKLSPGTQLLLIPWAGPAWLYNQTAPQVMSKWKKVDTYDNFTLVGKMDPPTWVSASPANVENIMKGIHAQVAAPGGTDWRQPFRYAMEANPAPDVIIFMTDGQIPPNTAGRALSAIDSSLKKGSRVPVVNCLWIKNRTEKSDYLKTLAAKYKGEFREVSEQSASKD